MSESVAFESVKGAVVAHDQWRVGAWAASLRRRWPVAAGPRFRTAAAAYLVVGAFAAGDALARHAGADVKEGLVVGALLAGPLIVALIGNRITGVRAFSVEIGLSEVAVEVEGDFTGAVMATAETGASALPDLLGTLRSAIRSHWKLLRVNLRDDDYWWSTRVFLVAALATDYTDVDALVFVRAGKQRLFVGISSARAVRTRLAARFPGYEAAYRKVRADALASSAGSGDREVEEILSWRWAAALEPSEAAAKVIVRGEELRRWLDGDLDDEAVPYGPLNRLLRYRIATRQGRYAALTNGLQLVEVVDRDELSRRSAVADLEHRLR
ncbi:MAG: hypothetical protein M3024_16195 [Candidatus Dormibacteraeota bacterium]|nr:hypothetical protein [Candidatus Dormibacteraeota bacterium]